MIFDIIMFKSSGRKILQNGFYLKAPLWVVKITNKTIMSNSAMVPDCSEPLDRSPLH